MVRIGRDLDVMVHHVEELNTVVNAATRDDVRSKVGAACEDRGHRAVAEAPRRQQRSRVTDPTFSMVHMTSLWARKSLDSLAQRYHSLMPAGSRGLVNIYRRPDARIIGLFIAACVLLLVVYICVGSALRWGDDDYCLSIAHDLAVTDLEDQQTSLWPPGMVCTYTTESGTVVRGPLLIHLWYGIASIPFIAGLIIVLSRMRREIADIRASRRNLQRESAS